MGQGTEPERLFVQQDGKLDLVGIVATVASSIVEVFLLCLVGYFLSRKGIIDARAKKQLNRLNVAFFTPALMFSKVAFSLTPEKLKDLYVIPIFFVILTGVSGLAAWLTAWILRISRSQRNFAISASMFMNSNSLPVALMQSLILTIHKDLAWDSADSKEQELGRALSYLVVFSTLGLIARWSFGVSLLRASDDRPSPLSSPIDDPGALPPSDSQTSPLLGERPRRDVNSTSSLPSRARNNPDRIMTPPRKNPSVTRLNGSEARPGPVYHSFPNTPRWRTPTPSVGSPSRGGSEPEDEGDDGDDVATERAEGDDEGEGEETPSLAKLQARQDRLEWGGFRRGELGAKAKKKLAAGPEWPRIRKAGRWVKRMYRRVASFMTPPLYASLLSVLVACIPPVQKVLDRIEPLRGALMSAGNVSVPLTLVVLGAYFNPTPETPSSSLSPTAAHTDPARRPPGERRTIFASIFARQILTPLLLVPVLLAFAVFSRDTIDDDPCFVVVAVLLIGAPPAVTLAQMTAASGAAFERLVSKSLLISYAVVTPPTTIVLVVIGLMIDAKQREHHGVG